MAAIDTGLCDADGWELDEDCLNIPDDTPPGVLERYRIAAAEYLWAATGRRLGPSCPITVRPCLKKCAETYSDIIPLGSSSLPWIPYIGADGRYYNASLCGCGTECHCGPQLCEVFLSGPVYDVVRVDIDGTTVDPSTYTLQNGYLTRLGAECWPACQDMTRGEGEENTFFITYRTGLALPTIASLALTKLTEHWVRDCSGGACGCGTSPSPNLSRLSRQGADFEFETVVDTAESGRTGIAEVDWFIRQWNPHGLMRPARVASPDSPKRPRVWRSANAEVRP